MSPRGPPRGPILPMPRSVMYWPVATPAGICTGTVCSPRTRPAEEMAEATESAEVAHEDVQRFAEVDVVEATAATSTAQSGLTEAIVQRAFLRIAEHIVRFGNFLEFLFSVLRAVVAIRVPTGRKFSVRLLHIVILCRASDVEDLVKIGHG